MKKGLLAALLAGAVFAAASAPAQNFPNKPMRIIVPYGPGGGNDLIARMIGEKLSQRLGQPVIVDNKPGAGGNIGAEAVARAPADGHTILIAANTFVVSPNLVKQLPFDVQKDFAPIIVAAWTPLVMVVNPDVPAKTVSEFVGHAKAAPGFVNYATPGNGTPQHLAAELFQNMTGTKMVHVPYKGASQMVPELLSGRVHVLFGAINTLLPHMKTGRLRGIAVTANKRTPFAPELPTIDESGVPGYHIDVWYGFLAPAGTPVDVVKRLNAEIHDILKTPEIRDRLAGQGIESAGGTPEQFAVIIKNDLARYAKVAKDAGIKPE